MLPSPGDKTLSVHYREQFGLAAHHKVVGNAGWLIPRKRWDVYLKVAAKVAAVVPDARFLVAGDGEELSRLKQLASDLKISDRVIWLGWQRDLEPFYRSLDVMLFNSDWDAMGRTPLEAMAHGVPVVASVMHGGLKELFDSNEYGFLINEHDIPLLAGKVIELLENKSMAVAIGAKARAHIEVIGDPQLHAERVLEVLMGKSPDGQRAPSNLVSAR